MLNVVCHGFGSFPVLFYHLIREANRRKLRINWSIILTSDHHIKKIKEVVTYKNICLLSKKSCDFDIKHIVNIRKIYKGNIFEDLGSEKMEFLYAKSDEIMQNTWSLFFSATQFFKKIKPDIALCSQVEGVDGKIFIEAAKYVGAKILVPTGARTFGGIFFSDNDKEKLPFKNKKNNPAEIKHAKQWLVEFRRKPKEAKNFVIDKSELLDPLKLQFLKRAKAGVLRWLNAGPLFRPTEVRVSLLNNAIIFRDVFFNINRVFNEKIFTIKNTKALPKKYIYYPLQYSPESSINTPAPFFVDQLRAIDAIRFAMPNDCVLVVKEHPSCVFTRSSSFLKKLIKLPGVEIASIKINSLDLIKKAGLVITVTGTSALEALLHGKNAIVLGDCFFAQAAGGVCSLNNLRKRISKNFGKKYPDKKALSLIAQMKKCTYQLNFGSPGMLGEPILRKNNINKILDAILDHCDKLRFF